MNCKYCAKKDRVRSKRQTKTFVLLAFSYVQWWMQGEGGASPHMDQNVL